MDITLDSGVLRRLFENVCFINGMGFAGKSTMVRMLAEKYGGLWCGENYSEKWFGLIDPERQPCLGYFQTMPGWQDFVSRAPEEYEAWYDGCSAEGVQLELIELIRCAAEGRRVFVDTNIPLPILREISDYRRVAVMLTAPGFAADRFFDRPDAEKQFLYRCIMETEDPEATLANFRACIERVNSPERRRAFEESGFFVLERDDRRTPAQTLAILERHFGLLEEKR